MRDPEERGPIGLHPPLRRATKRDAWALAGLIEYPGHGILGYPWSRNAKEGHPQ